MPKAVGLHGAVAAVTRQGAGSQVKGKGPSQDLTAGKMEISHGNMSSIVNAKGWRLAFSYPWRKV